MTKTKTRKRRRDRRPTKTIRKQKHGGAYNPFGFVKRLLFPDKNKNKATNNNPEPPPTNKIDIKSIRTTLQPKIESKKKGLSNILRMVCKDPVKCIALGKYNEYLKEYFGQFKDLSLIDTSKMKRIGAPSVNGFVIKLPFKRPESDFTGYTVMKCAATQTADNLFYEYFVGKEYINEIATKLPNFLETYGIYKFKNESEWSNAKKFADQKTQEYSIDLKNMLIPANDLTIPQSCVDNKNFCILTQYFDKLYPFSEYFYHRVKFHEIEYDMFGLMYQVYFALTSLAPNYTHYDLHQSNVLLYKPYDGSKQYIEMHYHTKSGRVIEFPTEYVCKIIDYGRNYANPEGKPGSAKFIQEMCASINTCDNDCGRYKGYNVIQGNSIDVDEKRRSYMSPNKFNNAHDLRLIYSLRRSDFGQKILSDQEKLSYSIKYTDYEIPAYNNFFDGICNIIYKGNYGTPNIEDDEIQSLDALNANANNSLPDILTIFDAREMLEKHIDDFVSQGSYPSKYQDWEKVADMHIYEDGREYEFIELLKPELSLQDQIKVMKEKVAAEKLKFEEKQKLMAQELATEEEEEQKLSLSSSSSSFQTPSPKQVKNPKLLNQGLHKMLDDESESASFLTQGQPLSIGNFTPSTNEEIREAIEQYRAMQFPRIYWQLWDKGKFNEWDVSKITDMSNLFKNLENFNEDISNWTVDNVTNMEGMFFNCRAFNKPIGNWNVGNVTNMKKMFGNCVNFNQPLDQWDVHNVKNMDSMFQGASHFNQSLNSWDISNVKSARNIFVHSGLEKKNHPGGAQRVGGARRVGRQNVSTKKLLRPRNSNMLSRRR